MLAFAVKTACKKICLQLAAEVPPEWTVRQPREISADDDPNPIIGKQVNDSKTVQTRQQANALRLRDCVLSDYLIQGPVVECMDGKQAAVLDRKRFLFPVAK